MFFSSLPPAIASTTSLKEVLSMPRRKGTSGHQVVRNQFPPSLLLQVFLILSFFFLPLSAMAQTPSPPMQEKQLRILRITPAGVDVPPGRQIVIQFDRPVVPLGRMERKSEELPITIEPQLSCQWRWLNSATLTCNLNEKDTLRAATEYTITILPGIMTAENATLAEPVRHSFFTERPRVTESWFKTWLGPLLPQSSIRFNLPMDETSLSPHFFYALAGGRRIPAVVERDPDYESSSGQKNKTWLVRPQTDLPGGIPAELTVEPGVLSLHGSAPGVERRVIETVYAIPEFRFLGVRCTAKNNTTFDLLPDSPPALKQRCLPSGGVSLLFSAPVLAEALQNDLQLTPPLATSSPDNNPWEQIYSYSRLYEPYSKGKDYSIDLPESVLRPYTQYRLQLPAGAAEDEFDRSLAEPIDMTFATDHRAPDYALLKNMPMLEKDLDTDAHVWAVNIMELRLNFETLTADGKNSPGKKIIKPTGPQDASIPVPLSIRELIGQDSGVVQGTFTTRPPLPGKSPEQSWFFAQVTPFQVHLKLGHHNSLVWITDLRSGQPVEGVHLKVLKSTFKAIGSTGNALASATTDKNGIAMLPGTSIVDPRLQQIWANGKDEQGLFLTCRKDSDIAVLPVRYDYQVSAEGANREYIPDWLRPLYGHIHVWGATAQGIYKAGDTMQYKIFVRDQNNLHFTRPPGVAGPANDANVVKTSPRYHLKVLDPMDKVVYERDALVLSSFGAIHGEVGLAKTGAVGWYRFILSANFTKEEWEAMRVLVSDFTPAPFKVNTDLNGNGFATGDTITVTSEAKLHAGGAYSNAATRVTATLNPRAFTPDSPRIRGFQFDSFDRTDEKKAGAETLYETQSSLDENGQLLNTFTVVETPVWYGQLTVESSVRDDRGKSIANRSSVPCFGRDRYVGLLQEDWTLQAGKAARVKVVVVDRDGSMVAGVPLTLKTEHKKTYGARVKGAGDGYLTEYEHTWEQEQEITGVSTGEPLEFDFTPEQAGSFRLIAAVTDTNGRRQTTVVNRWVTGKGVVLWEETPGNLLSVYPEKSTYNIGETARFLVQNPFPGAQALITVERFGVIDHWTRTFANSSEIIEFPVLPDYLPGFYVSVMVTAPRVEQPLGPEGEDLGKPTYRMGYVKIPVKDPYKELVVDIKPEKDVYKPRDTVRVQLQVRPRNLDPEETKPPVELAVAVLDEAVFDLLAEGRKNYDPYLGFYSLDELDLSNYNLLMQLVGREKLAMKGASAGGGGGPDLSLRSLFKFVSYWNPTLLPDAEGKASIEFQVPDNLTGWKVLAMAVSPEDRMGLGEATFKVNQATEIRPALPNQVLTGDRFSAGFTFMNRTDEQRDITIHFTAQGPVKTDAEAPVDISRRLSLAPFQRETIHFPLQVTGPGAVAMVVTAGDEKDQDGLSVTLPVGSRKPQKVAASHGMVSDAPVTEHILFPENMQKDSGMLTLQLSPSVIGGVDGAFRFLRDYPYSCWEQKLSRGVMAAMYGPLGPYLQKDFRWPDSSKTVAETLALASEHQAPSGGMTYYKPKDEYVSPYLSAFSALAFNLLRQEGYRPPEQVERRLQNYLLNLLRHDAMPQEFSGTMTATVRAVALAALAERGKVLLADVLRYVPHLSEMNLFGKAFFLKALLTTGGSLQLQREILDSLLAHADQRSGQVIFSESIDNGFQSLLASPVRDNAAILSGLLTWLKANPADTTVRDLAVNLMRTLTLSRKASDHWPNTQENIFVVKALAEYARLYEDQGPDMTVEGRLDQESLGTGHFTAYTNQPLVFSRPLQDGDSGRRALLELNKSGNGRLYYGARLSYSPDQADTDAVNAGIEVYREYSVKRDGKWLLLAGKMALHTGEVVKVDLYASLPAERFFVVLEDPVPGGLEPVNRDLATASVQDAETGPTEDAADSFHRKYTDWQEDTFSRWSFYHRELRHDAVRFYSERLPAGRYHLSYTAQAIAQGEFQVLPVHAEEMYAPDIYGNGVSAQLKIEAAE